MAKYTRAEEVRIRLIGKVRFTESEEDENRMHLRLLDRLINEAEGDVEHDLSPRYDIPFQTDDGCAFSRLPERPTLEVLRTLCELKAVIRVLETDFGSGSAVDADKYAEKIQKRYDKMVEKQLAKRKVGGEETTQFLYPPLKGLKLAPHNTESDDGYVGQVLVSGQGDGGFAAAQINDPSENYWNGTVDEI